MHSKNLITGIPVAPIGEDATLGLTEFQLGDVDSASGDAAGWLSELIFTGNGGDRTPKSGRFIALAELYDCLRIIA